MMGVAEQAYMASDDSGTLVPFKGRDMTAMRADQRDEDSKWLTTTEIARLSGVLQRNVYKAIVAGVWRDAVLKVRQVPSSRGQSNRIFQAHVDSLPRDLREAWYLAQGIDLSAPVTPVTARSAEVADPAHDPAWQEAVVLARWKAQLESSATDFES